MKNPVTATYFECIGVLDFLRDLHGSSDYQKVLLYNYLFPLISSVEGGGGGCRGKFGHSEHEMEQLLVRLTKRFNAQLLIKLLNGLKNILQGILNGVDCGV